MKYQTRLGISVLFVAAVVAMLIQSRADFEAQLLKQRAEDIRPVVTKFMDGIPVSRVEFGLSGEAVTGEDLLGWLDQYLGGKLTEVITPNELTELANARVLRYGMLWRQH